MNTAVLGDVLESSSSSPPVAEAAEHSRAAEELPLGTCIHGKYIIHGVLGHGGFAIVYDAEHLGLARRVAIKVLHLRAETPLALVERFHREARISALVRHPNVLEVYDTGALPDGSPFLVMERVDGETLSTAIARGRLPVALVVELGCQLLRAIEAIADVGIVHRDIKPDNVMLHMPNDGAPVVKLVDFGIARQVAIEASSRLTVHGALVGTPQYMSPEQIRGQDVDVRSDLYAIGAVLYEALTGRAPHESTNFSELVVAVLNSQLVPPSELRPNCPPVLEQILMRALARSRERRFSSPREMLQALDSHAVELGLPRGEEAFYTPDPAELSAPRQVIARDTLVRRLFPTTKRAARSLQLSAAAALVLMGGPVAWEWAAGDEAAARAGVVQSKATPMASAAADLALRVEQPGSVERKASQAASVGREGANTALANAAEPGEVREPGGPQVEPLAAVVVSGDRAEAHTTGLEGVAAAQAADPSVEVPQVAAAQFEAQAPTAVASHTTSPTKDAMAESEAASRSAKVVAMPSGADASAAAATMQRTAERAVLPSATGVVPSPSVRAQWERTMQAALAELVRGRLAEAQARYREAVRLDPGEATSFRGLGLVSARIGDQKVAREALLRYLELSPRASDAAAIRARLSSLR